MRTVFAVLLLLLPAGVFAQSADLPRTAEFCGDCHRAIFDGWKQSAHASAMESRLFQDTLKLAEQEFGGEARKVCLRCHAPTAALTDDLALLRKVSWEGITCDYCHSIREVSTSGGNPRARVEFNDVKSGPTKDVSSPAHRTVFSAVHTSSLACISCHEYKNALGFPVLSTYTEWKESPYAAGKQECQNCHMYTVRGAIVDPRVKESSASGINLHQMPGSRSPEQLNKAIRMRVSSERTGSLVKVTVRLTNTGAGHFVPTGSPLRRLILDVRLEPYGNGPPLQQTRTYTRTIADQKGAAIEREDIAFLRAAKVLQDTRIAPRETRTESFSFSVPSGKLARVEASLSYYYSPMAGAGAQQRIKFFTISRLIR
jgi:hypothetical protein